MAGKKPTPDVLNRAISDLSEPVLFKNLINKDDEGNWRLLELDNLVELMKNKPLPFRVGKNARTNEPQWEVDCETKMMSLDELLTKDCEDNWYYFDYKYMHEWFSDESKLLDDFNWKLFGVNKTGRDSTLWIGSKGAHTNCHQDSYGCNLIAQLHGRKEWLLFPPESGKTLKQTRVPYEESTIYSKFNFFSPQKEDEEAILEIERCPGVVVLEPGDVLFVPRGWWHFVESLDLSISVNVWLPLINDSESRLKEALVKLIMTRIGEELPSTEQPESSLEDSIKLIEKCLEECNKSKAQDSPCPKKIKLTTYTQPELSKEYPDFIKKIDYLGKEKFKQFLVEKRERFIQNFETKKNVKNLDNDDLSYKNVLEAVVKSICHPDVIDKIADLLLIDK